MSGQAQCRFSFNYRGKFFLIGKLNCSKSVKHLLVVFIITKLKKFITLSYKSIADKFSNKRGKLRICLTNPSSKRNTVCYIGKLFRSDCIKIVKYSVLKNLGMKRRYTVYAVRAGNAKISHSYYAA